MHLKSLGLSLPDQINLLDPGIGEGQSAGASLYRPPGLPLSEAEAGKYIATVLAMEGQFKSATELGSFARAEAEDFFSQTSMGVRSEFARHSGGSSDHGQETLQRQAQMALLLFWTMERSLLEVSALEHKVEGLWQAYGHVLGLDRESYQAQGTGPEVQGLDMTSVFTGPLSWENLLPWFLYFLPEDGRLIAFDRALEEAWLEHGLSPLEVTGGQLAEMGGWAPSQLDGSGTEFQARGWQLCLMERPPEDRPWLDREFSVLTFQPGSRQR